MSRDLFVSCTPETVSETHINFMEAVFQALNHHDQLKPKSVETRPTTEKNMLYSVQSVGVVCTELDGFI